MTDALRHVHVDLEPRYTVHVGAGAVRELRRRSEGWHRTFVLTDENVARAHGTLVAGLPRAVVHAVPAGEESKSFAVLESVLDAMVSAGCDRASGVVAFGGGVVGDLGGLAAALFHRGVPCVQAPTTLLAMVDSSVGGKTAVNLRGGKNLAGAFHQPVEVFADTELLATLPDAEYLSGLGEVLKTAWLSESILARVEARAEALVAREPEAVAEAVEDCVRRKAQIVARDPFEKGERKLLNLGHTFAHAIERVAGYGRVAHGIAVAVGIGLALQSARIAGFVADDRALLRYRALAQRLELPGDLAALARAHPGVALDVDALWAAMHSDKKSKGGRPAFVVPLAPGTVRWDVELSEDAVRAALRASLGA